MSAGHPDSSMYEDSTVNTPSTKGIKAEKAITVNGGAVTLNCLDDSIHAPYATVNGGELTLSSDDDGIHADEVLTVNGGTVNILSSYEGIEGRVISINGGKLNINSSDDGFNAASGGTAASAQGNQGFPAKPAGRGGMQDYDSGCVISMTNGFVLINAEGDGVDSNGSVSMTGGKMIVFGPTRGGNGALDYGGTFTVSGGTLFASGPIGMAQSVTGDGVPVLSFNTNGSAGRVYALTDSSLDCKTAFTAPKSFQNVVFASDSLSPAQTYSFYEDGTLSPDGEEISGICFSGSYSPGTLLGTLG